MLYVVLMPHFYDSAITRWWHHIPHHSVSKLSWVPKSTQLCKTRAGSSRKPSNLACYGNIVLWGPLEISANHALLFINLKTLYSLGQILMALFYLVIAAFWIRSSGTECIRKESVNHAVFIKKVWGFWIYIKIMSNIKYLTDLGVHFERRWKHNFWCMI